MTDSSDRVDCSPPGPSAHGIFQARIVEWFAIPFSRGFSWPRDRTHVSCIASNFFTTEPPGNPIRDKGIQQILQVKKKLFVLFCKLDKNCSLSFKLVEQSAWTFFFFLVCWLVIACVAKFGQRAGVHFHCNNQLGRKVNSKPSQLPVATKLNLLIMRAWANGLGHFVKQSLDSSQKGVPQFFLISDFLLGEAIRAEK